MDSQIRPGKGDGRRFRERGRVRTSSRDDDGDGDGLLKLASASALELIGRNCNDGFLKLVVEEGGAYMVVKIIIAMVRMKLDGSTEGIGSLIKDLEDPLESVELRMNVLSDPRQAKAKAVELIEAFRNRIEEELPGWELDSCGDCWVSEGCPVDSNDDRTAIDAHMYRAKVSDEKHEQHGWVHIRQGIHNPNIAINMQSTVFGGCRNMTRVLRDRFLIDRGLDKYVDMTQINKYADS